MRAKGLTRPTNRAQLAAREAKQKASDKKPGGEPPAPPVEGPVPTDQVNLTDESHIMPVSGGGFEQCYNAQAIVAEGSLLVVASVVVQAAEMTSSSSNRCWPNLRPA